MGPDLRLGRTLDEHYEETRGADRVVVLGFCAPFFTAAATVAGLRAVNAAVEGTALPRIPDAVIEEIVHRPSLDLLEIA